MARVKDIGDQLVEEILDSHWNDGTDKYDFEEWLEFEFSRKLAEIITGKRRVEIKDAKKKSNKKSNSQSARYRFI